VGYLLLFALTLSIRTLLAALGAKDATGNKIPAMIAILDQALGRPRSRSSAKAEAISPRCAPSIWGKSTCD